MRIIFKLIFRFDFDVNFDVIDQRGKVFKCLLSAPNDFWSNMHESVERSSIKGTCRSKDQYRELTIDPNSISGVLEDASGISFSKITENEVFEQFDKIVSNYKDAFGLNNIKRAGLRVFLFENYGDNFSDQSQSFRQAFNPTFLEQFNQDIGKINDAGITFDGETNDGLNFHLNFGHFYEDDIGKFIHNAPVSEDAYKKLLGNHATVDFDLYEHDISFSSLTLKKWTKDKWPIINDFMVNYKEMMIND